MACVAAGTGVTSSAAIIVPAGGLSGQRTLGDGLAGNYNVTVSFNVVPDSDLLLYTYEFSVSADDRGRIRPGLSNLHVELSEGCSDSNASCLIDVVSVTSGDISFGTFSNHVPSLLRGMKIDDAGDVPSLTLALRSNRAPMWGDIAGKGGQSAFYNAGFGTAAADPESADDLVNRNWVLVPDTEQYVVPEPVTTLVVGAGLFAIGLLRRRRAR
jgi:hypothetical protein